MRKKIKQIILMMLVGMMLTGSAVPVLAEDTAAADTAAEKETIPTVTLKKQKFTQKTSTAKKKSKDVEIGETIVKMPAKGMGYLKFTAPKKGTYKFTFSDLKKKKGIRGYINLQVPKTGKTTKLIKKKVNTWGGSTHELWIGIKDYKHKTYPKIYWPRAVRNAKVKLKKGQEIYVFFSFEAKDTLHLKIKKV